MTWTFNSALAPRRPNKMRNLSWERLDVGESLLSFAAGALTGLPEDFAAEF